MVVVNCIIADRCFSLAVPSSIIQFLIALIHFYCFIGWDSYVCTCPPHAGILCPYMDIIHVHVFL